jgi:hypothetical protein
MGSRVYASLDEVERDVKRGYFANEPELRQAFIEALKSELRVYCSPELVNHALDVMIDRCIEQSRKKPDIRLFAFSNVVIEIEPPRADLDRGRKQLIDDYIPKLIQSLRTESLTVHGIVTNGVEAEYWVFSNGQLKCEAEEEMAQVVRQVLSIFCKEKITVVTAEDLLAILGV